MVEVDLNRWLQSAGALSVELWFRKPAQPSWIQKIIRWRTNSDFSHVELVVGFNGKFYGFSSDISKGVRVVELQPSDEWERVWLLLPPRCRAHEGCDKKPVEHVLTWFFERIGKAPYDLRALVEWFNARPSSDAKAYTCAESVCEAVQSAGLWPRLDARRVSPKDLWIAAETFSEGVLCGVSMQ